jgi:predicted PurR-regulated permease PerM
LSFTFSALPFVGPYLVVIPSSIDLYYRSATAIPALMLMLSHLVVYWFVDPIIYGEIQGGTHAYVIALSVVGGLYLMGAEGIILGWLLMLQLCCCWFL